MLDDVRRGARRHARLLGTVGFVALGILLVPVSAGVYWVDQPRLVTWWADLALILLLGVVHFFRHRSPVGALLLAGVVIAVGALVTGATPLGTILIVADLLYLVAVRSPSRAVDVAQYVAGAVAVVGVLSLAVPGGPPELVVRFLWIPVTVVLSLWWGRAVRGPQLEAAAERARVEAVRRGAASERQSALASERMAIGRDLHDALAGHVVGIAMQAEAALRTARAERSATTPGLESIRASSLAALGEMRSMIDVLRGDGDALSTPPTLADLETLIDSQRAAGARLQAEVGDGIEWDVPAGVSVAAYRIVQEALSNAAKHAPGRPVELRIVRDDRGILITTRNPAGDGVELPDSLSGGHGLVGIAERARILGGYAQARVDRAPGDAQWILEARLPILHESTEATAGAAS
ncbi:histidine kinase [Agromyces humatus]|uniref:histidine kinase n=1 Tax=Agromyces humatus TaxID=279573 RepID=A0ABN2K2J5_9MICO